MYQPLISRCPETNAMVFSTPPEALAEQARQQARDAELEALKGLVAQLVAAQPKAVRTQLDAELLAVVTPQAG